MYRFYQRGRFIQGITLIVVLGLGMLSCSSLSKTEKGAAAGAGAGAVIGGAIGKVTGEGTAEGAILGAAIGGTAGAIIGQQMDKQAKELERELEGASVERVGEGIKVTFDSGLLFDFDSANLRPNVRDNLQELAESLYEYDSTEVLIVGHTDSLGTDVYNEALSERRAAAVAEYLNENGIATKRLMDVGKGEAEPVVSNETEEGRQQNRRVEIALFASEEYRERLKEQYE